MNNHTALSLKLDALAGNLEDIDNTLRLLYDSEKWTGETDYLHGDEFPKLREAIRDARKLRESFGTVREIINTVPGRN